MGPESRARGLTQRQIQAAERKEGISHPLIDVLERLAPRIAELNVTYDQFRDNQRPQRFIKQNFGFLADAVEEVGDFSLSPLELVAIWSKAVGVLRGYQRYAFAGMIASAYLMQGVTNPGWRGFPRHFLERNNLPAGVARDHVDLTNAQNRLTKIGDHLHALDYYVSGIKGSSMKYAASLGKKMSRGDERARALLDKMVERYKTRSSKVLSELQENFANGMIPLRLTLSDAVENATYKPLLKTSGKRS